MIEGNPAAVRKFNVDTETAPKLGVVVGNRPPVLSPQDVPGIMRLGEAVVFLARDYGPRHNYMAEWKGKQIGAPGNPKQWEGDTHVMDVWETQQFATYLRDLERGQSKVGGA